MAGELNEGVSRNLNQLSLDHLYYIKIYTPTYGSVTLRLYKNGSIWDRDGNRVVDNLYEMFNRFVRKVYVYLEFPEATYVLTNTHENWNILRAAGDPDADEVHDRKMRQMVSLFGMHKAILRDVDLMAVFKYLEEYPRSSTTSNPDDL